MHDQDGTNVDRDPARAVVRRLVADLDPPDATAVEHRSEVLAWIDRGDPLWRTAKPATPPEHLVSYAVLVDPVARAILLGEHRLAGRWLPTGGHVEPGEHPADAAARELREELAINPCELDGIGRRPLLLTRTAVLNVGETTGHVDVSLWFAFAGTRSQPLEPDPDEFAAIRWWPFTAIAHGFDTRFEPHLPRLVTALAAALDH